MDMIRAAIHLHVCVYDNIPAEKDAEYLDDLRGAVENVLVAVGFDVACVELEDVETCTS
jgi:hypothetical protein